MRGARKESDPEATSALCEEARPSDHVPNFQQERENVLVYVAFKLSLSRYVHPQAMKQELQQADNGKSLSFSAPDCAPATSTALQRLRF
jgi:hypothetical protein